MATKAQLRDQYIAQGWTVQPVANWLLVSSVDGLVKYDVQAVSPDRTRWGAAQVVVTDDGGPAEDADALGFWVDTPDATFASALHTYVRGLEGANVGGGVTVFAVRVLTDTISERDEVGEAIAYLSNDTKSRYAVKRRNGAFSQRVTTA